MRPGSRLDQFTSGAFIRTDPVFASSNPVSCELRSGAVEVNCWVWQHGKFS